MTFLSSNIDVGFPLLITSSTASENLPFETQIPQISMLLTTEILEDESDFIK